MQIKTTMQYHLTSHWMAMIIQTRENKTKRWWVAGKKEPFNTVLWNINGTAIMENTMEGPQKIKNRPTL